jgi:hypothetical protein
MCGSEIPFFSWNPNVNNSRIYKDLPLNPICSSCMQYNPFSKIVSFSTIFPICLWLYSHLLGLGRFFSFLISTRTGGLLGRGISLPQGRYLHTGQPQTQNRRTCLMWHLNPRSQCLSGGEDSSCLSHIPHAFYISRKSNFPYLFALIILKNIIMKFLK